jgi:hypothetical protein
VHPDPWHGVSRQEFVAVKDRLKARIGTLSPDQAQVEVMRLMAMISAYGRDGHMFSLPIDESGPSFLPLRLYEFAEGLFITAAMAPNEDLAGARVTQIGGHPIAQVLAAIEPLVPRDGPATVAAFRPAFLVRAAVLRGLGLAGPGDVELTVERDGTEGSVSLTPIGLDAYQEWAGIRGALLLPSRVDTPYLDEDATLAVNYLADARTLYVRYTAVQSLPDDVLQELEDRAADDDVDRVVVDLRQNPGGDNNRYVSLLRLLQSDEINRPGRLFLITDRQTFSAASNFATEVEQSTDAIFAGEPMGGGLNFWDDVSQFSFEHLPVPMRIAISTRYWQKSTRDDPRLTIEPTIAVPVRAADYFAGRDPTLEAVLGTKPASD